MIFQGKKYRRWAILLFLCSLIVVISTVRGKSETENIDIQMRQGKLFMTFYNTPAKSPYRWETIGWAITLKPIKSTASTVDNYDRSKCGNRIVLWYDDEYIDKNKKVKKGCFKREQGVEDGKVRTYYEFSEEYIQQQFQEVNWINLSEKTTLYMHAIFGTYKLNSDGTKTYYRDKRNPIYNWHDIAYYSFPQIGTWSSSAVRADFYKYFNKEVFYDPAMQPVDVIYEFQCLNGKSEMVNVVSNRFYEIKEAFTHTANIEESCSRYQDKKFLYTDKVEVYQYGSKGKMIKLTLNKEYQLKKDSVKSKLTLNTKVPYGGMKVVIHYQEVKKEPILYQREYGSIYQGKFASSGTMDHGNLGEVKNGESFTWANHSLVGPQYKWKKENGEGTGKVVSGKVGDDIYSCVGYYVVTNKSQKKTKTYLVGIDSMTLNDILKGSISKVVDGGATVHFLYEKADSTQHPIYTQRELEDGTILEMKTLVDYFDTNTTYKWSVKAKLFYNKTTKQYKEVKAGDGENYFDLVRVRITYEKDQSDLHNKMYSSKETYSGEFQVPSIGATIHFIYKGVQPSQEDSQEPTITITPTPTMMPPPEEEVPEADVISGGYEEPEATGEICADQRGSEKFDVEQGIPTTESLYVQVRGTRYILGYELTKKTGKIIYQVPVKITHVLKWQDAHGDSVLEPYEQTAIVPITRAYGYWEITQLDYYTIDGAKVYNNVLPEGNAVISANSIYNSIPELIYQHSENLSEHVLAPTEIRDNKTIEIDGTIVTGGKKKPSYEYLSQEYITAVVGHVIGKNSVKNDLLKFNGTVVMDDQVTLYDTGNVDTSALVACDVMCEPDCLYQKDYIIDASKLNETYYSTGIITYRRVASVNSRYYGGTMTYSIEGLNPVTIHTPVLCEPIAKGNNLPYVQLIHPNLDCLQLVLDENIMLNDFTLQISNSGEHIRQAGYNNRDFSYNLYEGPTKSNVKNSYIQKKNGVLRNEVKFPFDVYIHESDGIYKYIAKNTWILIGRDMVTFHLPMWVNEGEYTVDCRTVAVNCTEEFITQDEYHCNQSRYHYVATNSFSVEVSGRIYGMYIYDVTDYPIWSEVFRERNSLELKINHPNQHESGVMLPQYNKNAWYDYRSGINDSYGEDTKRLSKYTFPLMDGSHPKYNNVGVLKRGYTFRFSLSTIGNLYSDACKILIQPTFWHVDANGQNRTKVDLYYNEEINGEYHKLVKVGSNLDRVHLKQVRTGDPYLGIPKTELEATAGLKGMPYKTYVSQMEALFSFGQILISHPFRTFTNQAYRNRIMTSQEAEEIRNQGIRESDIDVRKQQWYAEYYIPGTAKAVKADFNVMEYARTYGVDDQSEFWMDDGYLIVNFDIYTVDEYGNRRLSYTNAENHIEENHCCMWVMEGFQVKKKDTNQREFQFKYGDVIMYDSIHNVNQDYIVGGTHG